MSRVVCWALLFVLAGCGRGDPPADADRQTPGAGALSAPAPGDGAVHIVRLVARGDQYGFEPEEVRIREGEVVRFVQTGYQAESVAFDLEAAPAGSMEVLAGHDVLHGPLLTEPGVFFDVVFDGAPPGTYPFFSVANRDRGMQGRVVVEASQ